MLKIVAIMIFAIILVVVVYSILTGGWANFTKCLGKQTARTTECVKEIFVKQRTGVVAGACVIDGLKNSAALFTGQLNLAVC